MKHLIERGLMFGNLVEVASPVLVERYNRALGHLTGKRTELEEFHVDISGYSPQIGAELGDDLYLNHAGVNRQFILLSTEQKRAPLLNAKFSTSRGILRQFIEENEAELFALTARDAVAGEIVNSVFLADTPARLFDIRSLRIEADTTGGTVAVAEKLGGMIDRFKSEDGAWHDDVLIAEMIGLAKTTGDVTRNPVVLKEMSFDQENFWTDHFGGLYIFRGVEHPAAISAGEKESLGPLPIPHVFDLGDRSQIAKFLQVNRLAEPIVTGRGIDAAAILRQKMEFILADVAATMGADLAGIDARGMRALGRRHAALLPEAWRGLDALARWAETGGDWPEITSDHPAYFYSLRATDHGDADLVNRLLAELCPLDIRQLFICHKEAFYRAYPSWPEAKRIYAADYLERAYMVDKPGARAALFAHEAPPPEPPPLPGRRDLIERVGPWGAVRGR